MPFVSVSFEERTIPRRNTESILTFHLFYALNCISQYTLKEQPCSKAFLHYVQSVLFYSFPSVLPILFKNRGVEIQNIIDFLIILFV